MCFCLARGFIDHMLAELDHLHAKRNKDLAEAETISLEMDQLQRDHARLQQQLSAVSSSRHPRIPTPTPTPTSVPTPGSVHRSPSPSPRASPGPSDAASPSPAIHDDIALPDSHATSPSGSPPPSITDATSDVETEVETTVTAPVPVEEPHTAEGTEIHADGE